MKNFVNTLLVFVCFLYFGFNSNLFAEDKTLNVILVKNNVTLDWSSMPKADYYDLFYALGKIDGSPDLDTLGHINMGKNTSLYVPNLPSGLTIYVAVLAHIGKNRIVSNIEKFVPINVTASFEVDDTVFMNVRENDTNNYFSLIGSKNQDNEYGLTEIRGNYNGNYINATISDNRITRIIIGGYFIDISYDSNGNVTSSGFKPITKSKTLQMNLKVSDNICSDDNAVWNEILKDEVLKSYYDNNLKEIKTRFGVFNIGLSIFSLTLQDKINDSFGVERTRYIDKVNTIQDFILTLYEISVAEIKDLKSKMIKDYKDENCNSVIDMKCPIPEGAVKVEMNNLRYYSLNGHYAGPYSLWSDINGEPFLVLEKCYDSEGVLNGWVGSYYTDGRAIYDHYNHGVKDFEYVYRNDKLVIYTNFLTHYTEYYDENETLVRYCDINGCYKP
jgi:hypothetical protein